MANREQSVVKFRLMILGDPQRGSGLSSGWGVNRPPDVQTVCLELCRIRPGMLTLRAERALWVNMPTLNDRSTLTRYTIVGPLK